MSKLTREFKIHLIVGSLYCVLNRTHSLAQPKLKKKNKIKTHEHDINFNFPYETS